MHNSCWPLSAMASLEEVAEWWRGWPVRRHRLSLALCTPSTERLAPGLQGGDALAPPPRDAIAVRIIVPGHRPPCWIFGKHKLRLTGAPCGSSSPSLGQAR